MSAAELVAFWRDELLGKPPLLLLPTDKPRTSTASALFGVPLELPAEHVKQLAAIGNAAAAGVFPVAHSSRKSELSWTVLAAFQVLLWRYSRQEDITIGTPKTAGGDELLPLRVDLDKPGLTFGELVRLNATKAKSICAHAGASLVQLAQAAGADKFDFSLGLHPAFQVAFLLEGSGEASRLSQGFNLDILLDLKEQAGGLSGQLCGKETFFSTATMRRMAKHFQNLIADVVAGADRPIVALEFVDEAEREKVMHKFNATEKELPAPYEGATIHGLFEHWATQTPDAPAISFEGKTLSYRELDERANQVARFLEANGVAPEQPVGVMLERSLELMVAMMGVLKAGGAFVPMDPEYPADRLALMAEDAEVPVLLSLERIEAAIPLPPTAKRVNLDTDWDQIAAFPAERPPQRRSHPGGLAYIIFTSGSTGRPKGTLLQHTGLINYLYHLISEHDLSGADVFLQKTPISFDVSVRELFFPFSVGAELVFAVPGGHRDTQYLAELIAARGITCASFVPSQLEIFLQEVDGVACKALRRVFVSGEALPPTSVAKFLELLPHAQLHNLYGPTEATVDVTGYDVRLHKGRATVPIGYPIANVKMYVLDAQLRPLPVGVPGELMISSRQLARGYIKRPDLSAEKFIDCPFGEGEYGKMYRTGDLARWLPEGVIEFLGRLDHQVKLRGFRIELGEIENGLCNCPGVRQAVVVVVKDHAGTSHLVAYVTPDTVDIPAAVKELSQNVPEYMVPEIIMPLKELPSLPNGKINRRGLPEPDFSVTATADYTAPRNGLEEEIQDAWHEVFQIQPISVDADFFRIGGNSLLAGKVISRLRAAFQVELPFTSIFQQRTVADMALFIQAQLQQQPPAPEGGGPAPPEDLNIPIFFSEKERCAGTATSYSQELLLFNNELDPFNPSHNEAAWVRCRGDLEVPALVRALRFLVDRHTVLGCHFMIAGAKGAMLQQTRPAKFRLPINYVDLVTGEELPLPEVGQAAVSSKGAKLPSKTLKRRQRLSTLKTANVGLLARGGSETTSAPSVTERVASRTASQTDAAHISLPTKATMNLAAQVEQLQATTAPQDAEQLSRLRTWLRGEDPNAPVQGGASTVQRTASATSSAGDGEGGANGAGNGSAEPRLPEVAPAESKPLLSPNSATTTASAPQTTTRPPPQQKAESSGCFGKHPREGVNPSGVSVRSAGGPSFARAKPLEIEESNDTVKEVEAIAWRVKKSLLLHYLTCGIYSVSQSGGTQGFWKGVRQNFASMAGYPEPEPTRTLREEADDEGGIMIPELATRKSAPSQGLRDLLLAEASRPFKIMQGPLLRCTLIKVREGEHVLLLNMHHSVTDGWSYGVIWRELSAAYNAFRKGLVHVELPPLPVQYADFATWQRRWLAQGVMAKQLKFWRSHLEGAKAIWDFPTDHFRSAVPSGTSERVPISLKKASVQAIKQLSTQVNATMFMALLAAYNVLLARYSGSESIVCGLPHAGRNRAETEGLIGAFMGAVALQGSLGGNPSFRQVMQRIRKAALEVFENADVPVHLVMVDILGLNGVGGCCAPPLFQTMFFLHDAGWLEGLKLDGVQAELPAKVEKNVARFDLTLEMTIDAGKDEVWGHVEYRSDLFARRTVEALVSHFEVLLESIVAQPDASIWDLGFLAPEDGRLLGGVRGVAPHLVPAGANARTARPRILSPRGYQMPVGIPGVLHVAYSADKDRRGSPGGRESGSLRSGGSSLMTRISGGFKTLFGDDREKANRAAPAPAPAGPVVQEAEVASLSPTARPLSPFGEPEPVPTAAAPAAAHAPLGSLKSASSSPGQEAGDQSLIPTPYHARVTREGKLEILGRVANKVEVSGIRTQLEDIDRQIRAVMPQVEQAATLQVVDAEGVARLVAFVSPKSLDLTALENRLRDEVPSFLVPHLLQPLARLPTLPHGEVDRAALPAPDWSLKVARPYLPPQNRLEVEVQLIWQAVMNKKDRISCDADFSDIGGNMMHAVIANGIVREALGCQMPAINLFRDRTIVNVAERIRQTRRKTRKSLSVAKSGASRTTSMD